MKFSSTFRAPLVLAALAMTAAASFASAEVSLDEAESKLWIKADSGPKWGQTVKIGEDQLTLEDGTLKVDLSGMEDQGFKMAVLTLVISEPTLEAGTAYEVSMEAKAGKGASGVLLVPEDSGEKNAKGDAKPKSKWFRTGGDWPEVRETFTCDPEVNKGNITVFFTGKQAGNVFEFRAINVEPAGEPS